MYEFESILKQGIIMLYLERAGFGTIRHTLPPGMSLSVPIFPFPFCFLLVDEEPADQAWDVREINEMAACVARRPVAAEYLQRV